MSKVWQASLVLCVINIVCCKLNLILLHNNDIHDRFEETERNIDICKPENRNKMCVGGFARTAHEIRRFRKLAVDGLGPDVLFLNAGDTFKGTAWYGVYKWEVAQDFINILRPDAMCLGNHEFDNGVAGLAPFVNAVQSPIVAANLDFTNEPSLSKVQKSVILEKSGVKIGIIGYLTPLTIESAITGKTIFSDEIESVKTESERLEALGVKIIIALGHSGYLIDQQIAAKVPLVDIVVGGHTNTFLWNGQQPDIEPVVDTYPKIVTQMSGKKVPVVQAYAFTKYLGILNVTFDDNGDLTYAAGQPVLLDSSIPQDKDVLARLDLYRPKIDQLYAEEVGITKVLLDGESISCKRRECNFGNLITDALVLYKASVSSQHWTETPIALYNAGAIRKSIYEGIITKGRLIAALPFGSEVVSLKLKGIDLIKTLDAGLRREDEDSSGGFLQISGLRVVYDNRKPAGSRVIAVKSRCGKCNIPSYEEIDVNKNYSIITTKSLAIDGGYGHSVLCENSFDKVIEDLRDIEIVTWYLYGYSPVYPELQGRITFVNEIDTDNTNVAIKLLNSKTLFIVMVYITVTSGLVTRYSF